MQNEHISTRIIVHKLRTTTLALTCPLWQFIIDQMTVKESSVTIPGLNFNVRLYLQADEWFQGKMLTLLESYEGPSASDDTSKGWNTLFMNVCIDSTTLRNTVELLRNTVEHLRNTVEHLRNNVEHLRNTVELQTLFVIRFAAWYQVESTLGIRLLSYRDGLVSK